MEALAALSVASSVVQFVDFASKLVSKGNSYYRSTDGVEEEHAKLEGAAKNLSRISEDLNDTLGRCSRSTDPLDGQPAIGLIVDAEKGSKPGPGEEALKQVAMDCQKIAVEFISILNKLKMHGPRKRWKSFRQALKSYWSKERIEAVLRRLQLAREDLVLHLLVALKYVWDI